MFLNPGDIGTTAGSCLSKDNCRPILGKPKSNP